MHSHDRTMVAQLGFNDPDKKDRRHDLACEYLADDSRLLSLLNREPWPAGFALTVRSPHTETGLWAGTDQYRRLVGFADVTAEVSVAGLHDVETTDRSGAWVKETHQACCRSRVLVEVKVAPVGMADVIRQLRLYRGHWPCFRESDAYAAYLYSRVHQFTWLVTSFQVSKPDVAALRREGISYARLGPAFEAWVKVRDVSPVEDADI